jgi:hypothetical protein
MLVEHGRPEAVAHALPRGTIRCYRRARQLIRIKGWYSVISETVEQVALASADPASQHDARDV